MSHEQSAAHATYVNDEAEFSEYEGLDFRKRKGDARSGIAQMQNRFNLDMDRPHPFRVYPDGYLLDGRDVGGESIMGYPFQVHVVADDQGALYVDEAGKLCQQTAIDDAGMVRSRWERPRYRNVTSSDGKEQNRPYAMDEDAMCAERYLAEEFGVSIQEASRDAKIQKRIEEINPALSLEELYKKQEAGKADGAMRAHEELRGKIGAEMDEGELYESGFIARRRMRQGERVNPRERTLEEFNRRHGLI